MARSRKTRTGKASRRARTAAYDVVEASLSQLHTAIKNRLVTSRQLTEIYIERIERFNFAGAKINCVREVNPDALAQADALDREFRRKGPRSLLHGLPILVKDNMGTADKMRTTVGVAALKDMKTPFEAAVVTKLRAAGAVILGKCNVTDFCDYMASAMPAGHSSAGGTIKNPYTGQQYPRGNGSSIGVAGAIAANFAAAAVGSETQNSIQAPACASSVVGIKPTVGLWSRSGIVPLAITQDTAGVIARTVYDAAYLLGVCAGVDFTDTVTLDALGHLHKDYTVFCNPKALQGARIGVPRAGFYGREGWGDHEEVVNRVLTAIHEAGAEIVDPADIATAPAVFPMASRVFRTDFKASFNHFLKSLGRHAPVKSMAELVAWNRKHPKAIPYGMDLLLAADATKGDWSEPEYHADRARDIRLTRDEGIDAALREYRLDALVCPMDRGSKLTGKAGYPSVSVPCGFTKNGRPVGVTFIGTAWSEPRLIALGYAFEQLTKARRIPKLTP